MVAAHFDGLHSRYTELTTNSVTLNNAVIPMIAATLSVLAPQIRGPWSSLNRYVVCMGREETLFLERNVFSTLEQDQDQDHTHETIIQ